MAMKRKKWIDVLKGIGAILVLFGHVINYDSFLKIFIYSFHMPLFFFIGGYLFKYDNNVWRFIIKKIKRLLIPYIIYSIISFCLSYFLEGIYISKREVLYNIFYLKGSNCFNSSLWFLVVMFWVVILFEMLYYVSKKEFIKFNKNYVTIFLLIVLFINLLLIRFDIKLLFGLEVVPHMLLIYSLGYLYKINESLIVNKLYRIKFKKVAFVLFFSLAFVLGQLNGRVNVSTSQYNNYFLYLFVSFIMICVCVYLSKTINENGILERLSNLSLIMFCTQRMLFKFILQIQNRVGVTLFQSEHLYMNILLTFLIIVIYLIYDYCKKGINVRIKKVMVSVFLAGLFICFNIDKIEAKDTGWEFKNDKYYYYDSVSDSYLSGWHDIDGLKYYFDPDTKERLQGIHEVDNNKYFFGVTKGKVMYGFIYYNGLIYYTDPDTGILSSGVTKIDDKSYFFGIRTNKLMYGLITDYNGDKYYTDSLGVLQSGFQNIDGKWYYFDPDTYKALSGWHDIDGLRYYFDPDTKERLQGIHEVDNNKYFFGVTKGKVMYGFIYYNGLIYYTDPDTGILSSGVTKIDDKSYFFGIRTNKLMYGLITDYNGDKYYTDSSGVLQSGFQNIDGKWYYFDPDTYKALSGWHDIDGLRYYFDPDTKERLQGIHEVDNNKYFFGVTKGKVMYGFIYYNGLIYYTDPDTGILSSGVTKIDDKSYFFGIRTNKLMYGLITDYNGDKYYTDSLGVLQSGFQNIDGKWYYFDPDTYKALSGLATIDDGEYYFDPISKERASYITQIDGKNYFYGIKYGKKQYGLIYYNDNYYYADPETGELREGWVTIDDNLYYYIPETKMRAKGVTKVENDYYFFGIKYGLIQRGWINYDGLSYYADPGTGHLYTGWNEVDGNKYFFGIRTKKVMKGWFTDPETGILYYLDRDTGILASGFREINSYIYYFEDGRYVTGDRTIDGRKYYFYSDGRMKSNFVTMNGNTYYYYEDGVKAVDWTTIGQTKYFFNIEGVMLGKNVKKILDVSVHNGYINWDVVKSTGDIDGVIIRINDARYDLGVEDPLLSYNISELQRLGIPYGIYMYTYGSSYSEGVDYANEAIRVINKYNMNPTLGIYLDIEGNRITNNFSTFQFEEHARGFLDTLGRNGYSSFSHLYTYKYFAENVLNTPYLKNNITWIAQYNDYNCTYNGTYDMWQYRSDGILDGIDGYVDISILYK